MPVNRSTHQRIVSERELGQFIRRLGILLAALIALVLAGTVGFTLIEGTSLPYGFEWTIDTITTVGSFPAPTDAGGRALKVGIELLGIGTLFYGFATVAEFFVSGQLSGLLEERRMEKKIDSFTDHYIICGFGRVGRQAARDLMGAGAQIVVIDDNAENREMARELDLPFIEDEGADDEVLLRARIDRARAVIACVDSDAENIFIALTARELRADMLIIARASAEESEKKLYRAGADRVISPYKTSGAEMARMALHPQVGVALQAADYRIEQIEVLPDCVGAGKTVEEVRGTSVIVALRRKGGGLEAQPAPQSAIGVGDMIIAIGSADALERLEAIFQPVADAALRAIR